MPKRSKPFSAKSSSAIRRLPVPMPAQMPGLRPPAHLRQQGPTPVGRGARQRPVGEVRFDEVHHSQALAVDADEAVEDVPVVESLPRALCGERARTPRTLTQSRY